MLPSMNMSKASLREGEDFSEYAYTTQLLRDDFHNNPEYIRKFLQIAKNANITLDPLFLGLRDSKSFTQNQKGYSETQNALGRAFLKGFVTQQFSTALPSDHPTYTVFAGPPGAGEPFVLAEEFGIDVSAGKFAANAITIGPDLIVMAQMPGLQEARTIPLGAQRSDAMVAAYCIDRDYSNAVANFMLVKALTEDLNVVHDSTLTSATAPKILDTIGKLGYQRIGRIHLAERTSRAIGLEKREQYYGGFALTTAKDATGKAIAAYERIADGSYMGRFDDLSIRVIKPEFYLGRGGAAEVAKYNPETGKMHMLPGGQAHIEGIVQKARDEEGITHDLLTAFTRAVNTWEKSSEMRERATNATKIKVS